MATEPKALKTPQERAFLEVQSELRQANQNIEDTQMNELNIRQLRALVNHLNQASAAASRLLGMLQVNEA